MVEHEGEVLQHLRLCFGMLQWENNKTSLPENSRNNEVYEFAFGFVPNLVEIIDEIGEELASQMLLNSTQLALLTTALKTHHQPEKRQLFEQQQASDGVVKAFKKYLETYGSAAGSSLIEALTNINNSSQYE